MWAAQCRYIQKLYPIMDFEVAVNQTVQLYLSDCIDCPDFSVGTGRYANEHWLHTHLQVNPCDVYPDLRYFSGYPGFKTDDLQPFSLAKAPRQFPTIKNGRFLKSEWTPQFLLRYRLQELQQLYNMTPGKDSFAWTWYKNQKSNLL